MTLDPQVAAILAAPSEPTTTLEEARAAYDRSALAQAGTVEDVASVSALDCGRLYVPADAVGGVLWMHGGGWVMGSVDAYDAFCRALANRCGAAVLSVDYRLAPEAQFPLALEDCEAALEVLASRFSPLAVGGDSAGGNLAAVVARRARDRGVSGVPLRFQLLVYPATDAACATGSMLSFGDGSYRVSREEMLECWEAYAPGASQRSADASCLRAASLAGLPPAFFVFAEYDPLLDEGLDYAERLASAGVPVETRTWPGTVHGFIRWRASVDAAHAALDEAAAAVRAALRA